MLDHLNLTSLIESANCNFKHLKFANNVGLLKFAILD